MPSHNSLNNSPLDTPRSSKGPPPDLSDAAIGSTGKEQILKQKIEERLKKYLSTSRDSASYSELIEILKTTKSFLGPAPSARQREILSDNQFLVSVLKDLLPSQSDQVAPLPRELRKLFELTLSIYKVCSPSPIYPVWEPPLESLLLGQALISGNLWAIPLLYKRCKVLPSLDQTQLISGIRDGLGRAITDFNHRRRDLFEGYLTYLKQISNILPDGVIAKALNQRRIRGTILARALSYESSFGVYKALVNLGASFVPNEQNSTSSARAAESEGPLFIFTAEGKKEVTFLELIKETHRLFFSPDLDCPLSLHDSFLRISRDIRHIYLYAAARFFALNKSLWGSVDGLPYRTAFAELLPLLYTQYPIGAVKGFMQEIDLFNANKNGFSGFHPNEAELFGLIPLYQDRKHRYQHLSYLTEALTSPYRFDLHGIPTVTPTRLKNWELLGKYGFSHLRWKIDSRSHGVDPETGSRINMLEAFGFNSSEKYCAESRNRGEQILGDARFGNGFFITGKELNGYSWYSRSRQTRLPFDPNLFVVLTRGYILVSHPERGTLLKVNSAPNVAMNRLFRHPCYWSSMGIEPCEPLPSFNWKEPASLLDSKTWRRWLSPSRSCFTQAELLGFNLDMIPNYFSNALNVRLNQSETGDILDRSLRYLLDNLEGVTQSYARWKFDTNSDTAWMRYEEGSQDAVLVGGYNSKGFKFLLRHLDALQDRSLFSPQLAFVDQERPPWLPYPWTHKGITRRTFSVGREELEILFALSEGTLSNSDWLGSGLREFFQVGMSRQAELIILD